MSLIGLYVTVGVAMAAMAGVNAVHEWILDRRVEKSRPHV